MNKKGEETMEFQADLQQQLVFLLRLVLSSVCGMAIGWER